MYAQDRDMCRQLHDAMERCNVRCMYECMYVRKWLKYLNSGKMYACMCIRCIMYVCNRVADISQQQEDICMYVCKMYACMCVRCMHVCV